MKTIVINSQKGGSGKTTLCAHLAVQAEQSGDGPVYLIDTDPQTLGLFVKAVLRAEERMKTDDGFWNAMLEKNLYALPNRAELPALRKQWAAGLPKSWTAADLNNTVLLTREMIEVAGPEVVGLTRLDTRAFNTTFRP